MKDVDLTSTACFTDKTVDLISKTPTGGIRNINPHQEIIKDILGSNNFYIIRDDQIKEIESELDLEEHYEDLFMGSLSNFKNHKKERCFEEGTTCIRCGNNIEKLSPEMVCRNCIIDMEQQRVINKLKQEWSWVKRF